MNFKRHLTIRRRFCASHKLTSHSGKCKNLHGHTFEALFVFEASMKLPEDNISCDFAKLKMIVDNCLPDHGHLNARYGVKDPTAEFLAQTLFGKVNDCVVNCGVWLISVEVFESSDCSAKFSVDE